MFNSWMRDPEAFSSDYEEYRQFMREQAQELPERDPLDYVREAEEAEAQERYERYAEDNFTDAEADADTLASAGMGTDEDYGMFDSGDEF